MKPSIPILLLTLLTLASAAVGLSGCNTIAGMGEDVEAAGGALENEAEEKKGY